MDSSQKYIVGKTPEGVTFYDFGNCIFYCNGGSLHPKEYPESAIRLMAGGGGACHKECDDCG
ncbi:MAG TPA: hypothetical protein IAB83_10890 [Candidatus Faecousia faecavium]|nr:hypothetical protein [Candidatus Faecousia faecavium]